MSTDSRSLSERISDLEAEVERLQKELNSSEEFWLSICVTREKSGYMRGRLDAASEFARSLLARRVEAGVAQTGVEGPDPRPGNQLPDRASGEEHRSSKSKVSGSIPDPSLDSTSDHEVCPHCWGSGHSDGLRHAVETLQKLSPIETLSGAISAVKYLQGSTFQIPKKVDHR